MAADTENREIIQSQKYDTCFFEKYAKIELDAVLGHDFDELVNLDRPDLQSPGSCRLGIEVTRAMEESKAAGLSLLQDIAGLTKTLPEEDLDRVLLSGYAYGLQTGKYVGVKEMPYWKMALPMRRILESKVSKVASGFYGRFDRLYIADVDDLFVCNLAEGLSASSRVERYRITQDQRRSFYEQVLHV